MNDENALTQTLREAGPRYVVDAQQRPVGYLLTPEEYADYLNLLEDRADNQDAERSEHLTRAVPPRKGIPGQQLLALAGTIPVADLNLMQQAIEADCETVDTHEW